MKLNTHTVCTKWLISSLIFESIVIIAFKVLQLKLLLDRVEVVKLFCCANNSALKIFLNFISQFNRLFGIFETYIRVSKLF